jgi:dTDP-glucose 4,6-dehydratase
MRKSTLETRSGLEDDTNRIVLVTGGAGFIGSNLIRYFLNNYPAYKIINFDKLTYAGNLNNLRNLEEDAHYVFVKGDVSNVKDVKNVFEEFNPDFVVHCAAESHVDRSLTNPEVFLTTNILGTQNMLDQAREHDVEKFIQISTDEVYGAKNYGHSADEEARLNPNNPYSASKAAADFLVRVAHQTYGQNVNVIRSCNNYGSFQFPEKLIPLMILNAMTDNDLPIYGNGKQIREWIHVQDHCSAIDLVLHNGRNGEIYNVGTRIERENLRLVNQILERFPESQSEIEFVQDRLGHDFRYAMNSKKIRTELSWQPRILFDDGLEQTIDWYKMNQDWINEIRSGEYLNYYADNYLSEIME